LGEQRLLFGEVILQLAGAGARLLRVPPEFGPLFRRDTFESGADRVALGSQSFDLGLEPAHIRIERQQIVEVEVDRFRLDGALDRVAVRPDEIQPKHGAALRELRVNRKFA
jgi:hypothetical protein